MMDIRNRLDSPKLRELVDQLEYPEEIRQAKTDQILAEYRDHPDQPFLGFESDGELVGFVGLRLGPPNEATIRHIAVRRDHRHSGIGSQMIKAVCQMYSLAGITAETDRDAVEFYRKIGFDIESLGEKYPGTERFQCCLRTARMR